jgi:hypothetical protein
VIPRRRAESGLGGQACGDGVGDGGERRHDPVAGRLDDGTARRVDALAQDGVVPGQGAAHGLGVSLPQPRARLQVGKEEGRHERNHKRTSRAAGGGAAPAGRAVRTHPVAVDLLHEVLAMVMSS